MLWIAGLAKQNTLRWSNQPPDYVCTTASFLRPADNITFPAAIPKPSGIKAQKFLL